MEQSLEYAPAELKQVFQKIFRVSNISISNKTQIRNSLENLIDHEGFESVLKVGSIVLVGANGNQVFDEVTDDTKLISFEIEANQQMSLNAFLRRVAKFQKCIVRAL